MEQAFSWPRVLLGLVVVAAIGLWAAASPQPASAVGEGVFQLDKTDYSVPEGTALLVTIQRTDGGTLTQDVQVILAVDGIPDIDIPAAEATKLITFPAGSNLSSKSVFIQTLNQEQFTDRQIQVTIRSVSNGGLIGLRSTAPVTLRGAGTPHVFAVNPDSGGAFPPTVLTVLGENFIHSGAAVQSSVIDVQFWPILGGAPTGPFTVTSGDVFDVTPTSLKVKVPSPGLTDFTAVLGNQAAATYHVRVTVDTTPALTPPTYLSPMSVDDQFVFTTGPTVTSLSVRQGPPTGGTQVIVSGTNFPAGAPNTPCGSLSMVTFGGLNVTSCRFTATANQILVTTPAHSSGPVDVIVTNGFPSPAVPDSRFTYQGAPFITGLSPNFGPQTGGNTVIISGSNFLVGAQQPSAVLFGGNAAVFTVVNDNQIIATAPPGSGVQQVKIVHPVSGTSDFRTEANYTYSSGPLINGLSPTHGPSPGGTIVTITGTGFVAGAVVKFGDNQAFSTVISATQISATAPAGSGIVTVSVNVNGTLSAPGPQAQFSYDGPTVTSVSPIAGPLAGGTAITIRGTNFTSASIVTIGNQTVVPVFVDPTTLTATTPGVAAGIAAHVRVTTGSGQSPESPADVFTYTSGPIVDSINPDNGPTLGGTIVIITGKNFTAPLGVTFGGIPATSFNINSATQITVLSPPNGTAGPADVRVTRNSDVSPVGPMTRFTYVSTTPKVTALTPNSGSTFGGVDVTITGLGFSGAACPGAVKFGSIAAASCTVVNDTTITTVAPPNVAGPTVVTVSTLNGTSDIVPNFTYISPGGTGGGSAPPAPSPGGTMTLTLYSRWTLITWTGPTGVFVSDAIRGTGVPGGTDLSGRISAVYLWNVATATWLGYFTGADGIPGAQDFSQFTPGAVYWVAILGTGQVSWVVRAP